MTALYVFSVICLAAVVSAGRWNDTHICCSSTVELMEINSRTYCCGEIPFNSETHICCADNLVFPVEDNKSDCCGDFDKPENGFTPFDNSKSTCCDGVVIHFESGENANRECCGAVTYDYETETCCGDNISPKEENMECCGKELYDKRTLKICTSEYDSETKEFKMAIVPIRDNHTDMCNITMFDFETEACCWSNVIFENVVVTKSADLRDDKYPSCCSGPSGTVAYNSTSQACCESTGQVIDVPVEKQVGSWHRACAGSLFDQATHECCNDKLIVRAQNYSGFCCGSELITNYTTHFCCNDVIVERNAKNTKSCCNNEVIDWDTQVCCDGVKPGGKDFECCYAGENPEVINRRTQKCSKEGVTNLDPEEVKKMESLDPLCRPE